MRWTGWSSKDSISPHMLFNCPCYSWSGFPKQNAWGHYHTGVMKRCIEGKNVAQQKHNIARVVDMPQKAENVFKVKSANLLAWITR